MIESTSNRTAAGGIGRGREGEVSDAWWSAAAASTWSVMGSSAAAVTAKVGESRCRARREPGERRRDAGNGAKEASRDGGIEKRPDPRPACC